MQLLELTRQLVIEDFSTNANQLSVPSGCTVTIVGDLRGQFQDLLTTLTLKGLPHRKQRFVFNGGIVGLVRPVSRAPFSPPCVRFWSLLPRRKRCAQEIHA